MRCFATSLFLCLLLGCSHAPSVSWDFEKGVDGKSTLSGKVWLLVDNKRHLVHDHPPVEDYRVLKRSEYAEYGIPQNALSACIGSGPVGSEDMYVKANSTNILVFSRWHGEAVPGSPSYKLLKTIGRDGDI